jgi:hypothetical protein
MSFNVRDWVHAQQNTTPKLFRQLAIGIPVTGVFSEVAEDLKRKHPEWYIKARIILAERPIMTCKQCGKEIPYHEFSKSGQRHKTFCSKRCADRVHWDHCIKKKGAA